MHKTSIEFQDTLWLQLEAYCQVTGAKSSGVIRLALEAFIADQIKSNEGFGRKHEQKIAQLLAVAGGNITAIGTRRKPRKKAVAIDGKSESDAQTQK